MMRYWKFQSGRGRIAPHLQIPTDRGVLKAFQPTIHFNNQNIQYAWAPKWGAMRPLPGLWACCPVPLRNFLSGRLYLNQKVSLPALGMETSNTGDLSAALTASLKTKSNPAVPDY
ncbi:MAG: hypothetical protein QX203_15595 [Methylococcaceae bacterium]